MSKTNPWWIKQRYNPQLGTYYVPMGQMPIIIAKRHNNSGYGINVMLRFENEMDYNAKLDELRASGERVR